MKYEDITCKDECFLCKIGWNNEQIEINSSVITLCEPHFKEATNNCIAFKNAFEKTKEISEEWEK